MEDSVFKALTDQAFELYLSFISSGFTREQAFELTKSQFSFVVLNRQVDEGRRTRRDMVRQAALSSMNTKEVNA